MTLCDFILIETPVGLLLATHMHIRTQYSILMNNTPVTHVHVW